MPSAILDILIAAGLLLGLIRGFATGAVRQITGLAGTVLSIVLAVEFMRPVGDAAGGLLGLGPQVALVVGFVLVFAAGQLVLRLLTRLIETSLKVLRLGIVNRLCGAVLGACKAALLLSVLFLALDFFRAPTQKHREASMLYGPVAAVFPASWDFVAGMFPSVQELSERFGREARGTIGEIGEDILPDNPLPEADPPEGEAPPDSAAENAPAEARAPVPDDAEPAETSAEAPNFESDAGSGPGSGPEAEEESAQE